MCSNVDYKSSSQRSRHPHIDLTGDFGARVRTGEVQSFANDDRDQAEPSKGAIVMKPEDAMTVADLQQLCAISLAIDKVGKMFNTCYAASDEALDHITKAGRLIHDAIIAARVDH